MMNADQLHARANFYRERAACAERDQDFELLSDLARTFDVLARDLRNWEAGVPRRDRASFRRSLRALLPSCLGD